MSIPDHNRSDFRTLLRAAADIAITPSGHLTEGNSCAQYQPLGLGDPDGFLPASGSDGPP
ncbi:hypothetical protein NIM87_07670 [Devosia sp. XJ19-1]|uniref:Uncharacterized protein n=1 Tax=Devosia ureilytica TaxID=2952754 RepID=A0A9Q4AMD3_9HYPH|nr:hypothetical protein [Devosia ureilytica]MCP8883371.1 hypothetical protein [Devosia ureilytica]MCP8886261.1 hypothetical protein [Devosia ureilytica]